MSQQAPRLVSGTSRRAPCSSCRKDTRHSTGSVQYGVGIQTYIYCTRCDRVTIYAGEGDRTRTLLRVYELRSCSAHGTYYHELLEEGSRCTACTPSILDPVDVQKGTTETPKVSPSVGTVIELAAKTGTDGS